MPPRKAAYALVSLGCPKNLVDSERMAGLLRDSDYRLVKDPAGADFVVINTCGFIGDAREESYETIREMLDLKRRGRLRGVIVAGCLAEREKESLLQKYPAIDQVVGVFAREEITAAAGRLMGDLGQERAVFRPAPSRPLPDGNRLRITPRHVAFLKIAEGCHRLCSFCTIPKIRGPYASKPIEEVVSEAEELAADGVRELVLVAQDTSSYGQDLYGRPRLAELLARLEEVGGLAWIRPMYLYPMHITDELIDVIASAGKVLPYLDMPLQHVSDEVLRGMRRQVNRRQTERLIDRLRQRIAGLVLRTTLMTGFPGETDVHFDELLDFVRRRRFERVGVFAYSEEPGTSAVNLPDKVPEEVKAARRDRLMAAQQEIAFAWNASQVGRRADVIVDRDIPGEENAWIGRTYADAPEVDGVVYVTGDGLAVGEIVPCEIVAAHDYDLIGAAQ
ncbi:MAG TPA: 30S ribosomal protein S12 methylthiotransferase RimO [Thermoguttaceae bacterium]|nr:30S ribosomal protein S12 methylthiotransferase RimO [Thermoguttaceae bacterium]